MNISVFGLGYVGCVSSACFCNKGYNLIGVDVNQEKINLIHKGKSPIKEHGLEEMLETCKANNNLFATSNAEEAVFKSDLTFITVGTPTSSDGSIDLRALFEVTESIGNALRIKDTYHLIVLRSTVPPGTSRECIKRIENISSKTAGKDFGWCMNPEFLREGTAVRDFYNPPFTVIGQYDERSGDTLERLYNRFPRIFGNTYRLNLEEAEMFKYVNNAFHAVKVDFANEVGRLCDSLDINAKKIMEIFVLDKKLNLSPYYLKPGLPFGGSCLPKDTRGISKIGKDLNLALPLLDSLGTSNKEHINHITHKIKNFGKKKIGFLGLTFKSDTDDLRESPLVLIARLLLDNGYDLKIYDTNLERDRLIGVNLSFLLEHLPEFESIMVESHRELTNFSELIVIGNKNHEYKYMVEFPKEEKIILDLAGVLKEKEHELDPFYECLARI